MERLSYIKYTSKEKALVAIKSLSDVRRLGRKGMTTRVYSKMRKHKDKNEYLIPILFDNDISSVPSGGVKIKTFKEGLWENEQ